MNIDKDLNLKNIRSNIEKLNKLVNNTNITNEYMTDSLSQAMSEVTFHWCNILTNFGEIEND